MTRQKWLVMVYFYFNAYYCLSIYFILHSPIKLHLCSHAVYQLGWTGCHSSRSCCLVLHRHTTYPRHPNTPHWSQVKRRVGKPSMFHLTSIKNTCLLRSAPVSWRNFSGSVSCQLQKMKTANLLHHFIICFINCCTIACTVQYFLIIDGQCTQRQKKAFMIVWVNDQPQPLPLTLHKPIAPCHCCVVV